LSTQSSITEILDKQKKDNDLRPHLGCSYAGHHCARYIWLNFRWAVTKQIDGRIMRLFKRGHDEEPRVIDLLKSIGLDITNYGEDQLSVHVKGHISGALDGIIQSGVPESPNEKHVLEIKTHSLKSFNDLIKNGVKASKPVHYSQVQLYMHATGIKKALYFAICKDDDRIYTEIIEYSSYAADSIVDHAHDVSLRDEIPERISHDPTWWICKMCAYHDTCHVSKLTKNVNCRTCAYSTAKPDGTWRCEKFEADGIPDEHQRKGCEHHVIHPHLTPWDVDQAFGGDGIAFKVADRDIINGKDGISSKELIDWYYGL